MPQGSRFLVALFLTVAMGSQSVLVLADTELVEPALTELLDLATDTTPPSEISENLEQQTATTTVLDVDAGEGNESISDLASTTRGSVLSSLSDSVINLFRAESAIVLGAPTEIIVVYELDRSIVLTIPATKIWPTAVRRFEESKKPRLFTNFFTAVSDWLISGAETVTEPQADGVSATSSQEIKTNPSTDRETSPSTEPISWWQTLWPQAFAQASEIEVSNLPDAEPDSLATSFISSSSAEVEINATSSHVSSLETTSWLKVGSTTISGELVYLPASDIAPARYQVIVPPGSVPLGLHEIFVSTTTSDGLIDSRFVVDVGGGAVRSYLVDSAYRFLVVTSEAGAESLWLETTSAGGIVYSIVARDTELMIGSPLAIFEGLLFYLDQTGQSIRGYDINAGVTVSTTIETTRATEITVASGEFFITPTATDFQFVSTEAVVY